jgi:hypothetical protein
MTMRRHSVPVAAGLLIRATAAVLLLVAAGCDRAAPPVMAPAAETTADHFFEGHWSAAGTRNGLDLAAGNRAEIMRLSGALVLTGKDRPHAAFKAEVIGFRDNVTGLQARSVWTDEHGDKAFSELSGGLDSTGRLIEGRFVGGTGRYAGVTGEYSFRWQTLVDTEDGGFSGRVTGLKGRARLAAPATNPQSPGGTR